MGKKEKEPEEKMKNRANKEPSNTSKPKTASANPPKPNQDTSSLALEERYGKASLVGYKTGKWDKAMVEFQKLENEGLAEASIALGQLAQMTDRKKALEHFRKAAAKGSAEGAWSVAAILGHSYKAEINGKDKEWYKYCLQAAQGGCCDAMNELGNLYNRIDDYLGAYYWYQMASYYEHPQALNALNGTLSKYIAAGKPKLVAKIDGVRPKDVQNTISIIRVLTKQDSFDNERMKEFRTLAMDDDNEIMCLFLGHFFEDIAKMDSDAKIGYQLAAHNNSIIGMKCLADMLMLGKGCDRNVELALDWYIEAADKDEKSACFIMGELSRKKNPNMAAYYYAKAFRRGYEAAFTRLQQM